MAKDKKIPANLVFTKEKFTYNTIQEVIDDVGLQPNTVVETNGYHNIGDGLGAKYIIAPVDDGDNIHLKNGYYAHEIPNSNGSKKVDKASTIEELKSMNLKVGDVIEVLGYYSADDGATHKRVIANSDDGSGVQLVNGKWANIVHNGEMNILWLGCKKDDDNFSVKNSEIINNQLKNRNTHLFFPKGTWSFNQIKFNSFCSLIGEDRNFTILKQVNNISNIGEDYNKNYAFLQANEYGENNNFKGVQRVTIKELTIQGIKQLGICGIKFLGLLDSKINTSDFNDCHNLIERVWFSEFDTGLYVGQFYKEYRILNCVSHWNLKDGMILNGSDCFISNCTCYSNDNNGYTVGASECRVIFSKAFYNKKSGFEIQDQGTYNSISSQENFEYGILINSSNQPILIHGFLGSNGISGGTPSEIKPNSSAIKVLGNYNKIRIDVFTSDFRSYNEQKQTSYSNYFIDLDGEGNSIQANVISQVKFNEIINLRDNHIETFYYNSSDLVSEYKIHQFDYNGIYELGNIFIKKVTGTRFSGVFGRCNISSPSSKDKNFNFEYRISKNENNDILFEIKRGTFPPSIKKFKLFYKIDNNNLYGKLCVENNGYDYPNFKFVNLGYTASMWIACDAYRRTFNNDGTWLEKEANFIYQVSQLDTPYYTTKMQQDGVYEDFIMYMDNKTAYDKQQRELEKERQKQYEKALIANPELKYEEWLSQQPIYLPNIDEPQPSEALQEFMKKYL